MRRAPTHPARGFTLTELTIVLVLVGVLAVVALPKLTNTHEFAARGALDFVASALRYAQKSAMAMRRNVCVDIAGSVVAATYASNAGASQACSAGNLLMQPGNGLAFSDAANALPDGSTVSAAASVVFDGEGRPLSAPGVARAAPLSITVNGYALPIVVEPETGYIH